MRLTYRGRLAEAGGAWTFRFGSDEPAAYEAGQSVKLELPAGFATQERRFTISSAPADGEITITTRPSDSAFKRALFGLEPGEGVVARSIEGTFVWDDADTARLFCASGIGITPYRSMLRQRHLSGQRLDALLLYAGRDDEFVFGGELRELAAQHPEFGIRFIAGRRLQARDITDATEDLPGAAVYLSGPSEMVDWLGAALTDGGLPAERLRRDWFTGRLGWDA